VRRGWFAAAAPATPCCFAHAHTTQQRTQPTHLQQQTNKQHLYITDYEAYPVFISKIRALQARYGALRRVRADGNCFFRAAGFALLEWLVQSGGEAACRRLLATLEACRKRMAATGFQELVYEDPYDALAGMVCGLFACVGGARLCCAVV
jgi:hypothetical protein